MYVTPLLTELKWLLSYNSFIEWVQNSLLPFNKFKIEGDNKNGIVQTNVSTHFLSVSFLFHSLQCHTNTQRGNNGDRSLNMWRVSPLRIIPQRYVTVASCIFEI